MRARFYDPEVGMFLSPDPVLGMPEDPASLMLYAYARNNPYRYADTSGLASRHAYDPFSDALRGHAPPPPPGYWPGHTATWDFDNYRHRIAQGVYQNVREQALQAEWGAQREQRMANPEPGYDNRTVHQAPGRQAVNYVRQQAGPSLGEGIRAGASAVGERAGTALNRVGQVIRAGVQRVEAAAQPYAAGAQRLSTVTSRGALAIRMADIAGEALAADDPTQVLSDRAVEFAGYAATSAVIGQAIGWIASAAPAAATVGGAVLGPIVLTTMSLERVAAATEQRGQGWLAGPRADWAEQRAQDTSRDIAQDRERHLDALRGKAAELQRLRSQLASQQSEAQALELEGANQRNAAQAKAGQVQALHGRIQSHDALLAGLRGRLRGVDTNKLRAMQAAIEALAQQACAEGTGVDRAGLARQAETQAAALEASANPPGYAQAMAQMEAEVGGADGFVSEAQEFQSALQGYRRAIQERYGIIQGLAAGYTAALQQARNLQAAVTGSANHLRLFLQGDDLATLSAIAQEASAGLPADGALIDAKQGAQESLGGVNVDTMMGGIVNEAQSHAGVAALYFAAVQADHGAAQGIAVRGREAANRARECAGRRDPRCAEMEGRFAAAADSRTAQAIVDEAAALGCSVSEAAIGEWNRRQAALCESYAQRLWATRNLNVARAIVAEANARGCNMQAAVEAWDNRQRQEAGQRAQQQQQQLQMFQNLMQDMPPTLPPAPTAEPPHQTHPPAPTTQPPQQTRPPAPTVPPPCQKVCVKEEVLWHNVTDGRHSLCAGGVARSPGPGIPPPKCVRSVRCLKWETRCR